jgi:ferredoxin
MDVRVSDYVQLGERVTSAECIACQACLSACPEGALTLSLGADPRRRELIRMRET